MAEDSAIYVNSSSHSRFVR